MKRRALLSHVKQQGCKLLREGCSHSVYWNPVNRQRASLPRHTEIIDTLARRKCKDLGIGRPTLK
ncbi:MAG: addiction module toxin, HicA family [Desulfobacca sp. 4484_104]|nr:MAG: addiction module toxin, HicA family [Desulfobacca sp. 4484_104]RLA90473.1 MAG: addiction module toxin, HicA family [Deltaproteobacteria bacterium]